MSMTRFLFVPVLLASIALAGCDKAELEATKQQLQTVTVERDNLKTQLDASKQQTAALDAAGEQPSDQAGGGGGRAGRPRQGGQGGQEERCRRQDWFRQVERARQGAGAVVGPASPPSSDHASSASRSSFVRPAAAAPSPRAASMSARLLSWSARIRSSTVPAATRR